MTGLRVAFVGKGGAGKSVIAGTLARLLARSGRRVLAVDSDPMPGLAFSLGLASSDAPLLDDLVEERPEGERPRWRLTVTPDEALERAAVTGPDGVRFLQFGKLRGPVGPYARSQMAFRQIVDGLSPEGWDIIGDLPGGTRQPFFGWAGFARTILIVAEPTTASLRTARRLARLALMSEPADLVVVANKVRAPEDSALIERSLELPVIAAIPSSQDVVAADRAGLAVVDTAGASVAVTAVQSLVARLEEVGV